MNSQRPIAILGAGAWGTALAIHLARQDRAVHLWGHDPHVMHKLELERCNQRYLPEIKFPSSLKVYDSLEQALRGVQDIMLVVPSHAVRAVLKQIVACAPSTLRVAWATKGLDVQENSGKFIHDIIMQEMGANTLTAVLSGPSFAKEVAAGLPTAVVIASQSDKFANDLVNRFHSTKFRVYKSADLLGVQICGAVKNIIAVAAGIADGLALGANARCALITRGLAEMSRLGRILGAKPETFMGLAGVGDLLLTCTSDLSRNRRFGLALGRDKTIATAKETVGGLVESVHNTKLVYQLAIQQDIEMPITEQVFKILEENRSSLEAFNALVNRGPAIEIR